jgi:hypothetical protein
VAQHDAADAALGGGADGGGDMTASVLLGAALALLASLLLNGSYVVQHRGSRGAPAVSARRPLRTLRGLIASRVWLAGTAAGLTGWALHVLALSQAPLSLVQAFSAGGLALVVPLAARITGVRLGRPERRAILLMGAALGALAVGSAASGAGVAPPVAMTVYLLICAAGATALAAAVGGRRRAPALGLAAGVLYGAADAATKAATGAAHAGLLAGVLSPWTAAVLITSIGAFFCFQRGLQIGPALPVIALMTAATNVVAVLGGITVFGESLGTSLAFSLVHGGALAAVVLCAWRLAPAQARLAEAPGDDPSFPQQPALPAPAAPPRRSQEAPARV